MGVVVHASVLPLINWITDVNRDSLGGTETFLDLAEMGLTNVSQRTRNDS